MMWRSPIVLVVLFLLLCRLQTGLGVTTLERVDPASGSFIDNFLGAKNITLFCQVRETALIQTVWLLRTKDNIQNNRQPGSVLGDDRFILTGDVIESGGFDVILNTNMTIVEMTAELDGAVIFCGGGDENFLGNFSLRAYKPPLLNDAVLITERENVRFRVDLSEGNRPAFPFPSSFTWSRTGGVAVENATGRMYEYPSVTIQSVQPSDTGNYTLTATNYLPDGTPVGTETGSFFLDVLFGASLTRGDMTVAVLEGRTVSLLCGRDLRGNPTPQVEWRNNSGVRISDGGRYTFSMGQEEVRLAIADAVRGDAGNWTCRAQVFQNGTIEVGDAVEYSIQLVVVVPPGAPEDLVADQTIGSTWISFSWQQSSMKRGIPPLSRHIILVSDSKREWNVTVEGSQANTNVTDLLPGTAYSFRVVAVSTSGSVSAESPASEVLVATTLVSAPAPECTDIPKVDDTRLVVVWKYAHTGGLTIESVSVQFQKDTANLNASFSDVDSSEVEGSGYMVDGGEASIPLPEAGIRYRFYVTATNRVGTTTVSCPDRVLNIGKPATPNTPEAKDDNKMVIVTVATLHSGVGDNAKDNFKFMFWISEAGGDSSNVIMRGIAVTCANGGGPCEGKLPLFADDLGAGKTYFVRAQAVNRYGMSEFSGNSETFSLDSTTVEPTSGSDKSSQGSNTGAVVGGVIGALVILALILLILVLAAYIFLKLRSGGTYKVEGGNSVKVEEVDIDLGTALGDMNDGTDAKELQYADLEYFQKQPPNTAAEETNMPTAIEDEPVQYATIQEINGKTISPTAQNPSSGGEGGAGGEGDKAQTSSTFV